MPNLIVTEKPSVAQAIAKALGIGKRRDGYLESDHYLVSWCVGHLVELAPPGSYDPKLVKWSKADLPILPKTWQYLVSTSTQRQFEVLRSLMARPDVDQLICATDAGREGELIFRLVYHQCGCTKSFTRLWISSMEDAAIREGFNHLKPSTEYDALYKAALCRERADWLVGINATRLFSCLYGQPLNVGRVMTPTLAMTVSREAAIDAFLPEPFYTVLLKMEDCMASSERFKDKSQAEALLAECRKASQAVLQKTERKEKVDWYDLETQETTQVEVTPEMAQELVSSWRTKRERGDEYGMVGAGEWYEQMDAYQAFFQGKTVEELKEWEATGLDENGKPVDAVSGATMSVNDAHSDILGAIYKAWDNRSDYIACEKEGYGFTYTVRQNAAGTTFYNVAFSRVKLDEAGKIVDNYEDVLEIADPTVTMASCPRYAVVGDTVDWYDLETQETTQVEVTPEMAQELVSSWRTKRERGDEYGMVGAGEWYEQMDAYQAFFNGKTAEELTQWEATGLDENGKPVDAVSGATMSINDAHSDILGALLKAMDAAV